MRGRGAAEQHRNRNRTKADPVGDHIAGVEVTGDCEGNFLERISPGAFAHTLAHDRN
jgi:hypothetical protein